MRWSTIPPIDFVGLPATYVLWQVEAEAIAAPLARLLWPYLREMKLLQDTLRKVDQSSDTYLLVKALYVYFERVGIAVIQAYFAKVQTLRQEAQAKGGSGGSTRSRGPLGATGAGQPGAGTVGANGRGTGGGANQPQYPLPTRPVGPGDGLAAPIAAFSTTGLSGLAGVSAGPDGIGERINWNGGAFGATDAFSGVPVAYVEPEAWNLATG